MKTYAAYYNNIIRDYSSSGGVFSLIASHFDVVYGVEMDKENRYAVYARKEGDISTLRGSKYIQAKVGESFKLIKDDLASDKKILFSGTACTVNGLMSFLRKDYENLFTVDVICHGAPTPTYWHKFIEGKEVKKVNFRSKDGGWDNYTYGMKLNDEYIPFNNNKYMSLYIQDYALRPSCYECISKKSKKSDITIGDFWGIEALDPEMTDNKGTSIVIVRSEKGQELFDSIKTKLVYREFEYDDAVTKNPSEYSSANRPIDRESFFRDMDKMSFLELYEKYGQDKHRGFCWAHRIKCIAKIVKGIITK